MTRRRKMLAGLAVAAVAVIGGCLDALAPRAPRAVARLGVVPVFDGAAGRDGIPADVDSIVVTIHNPPAADIVVAQHIAPGQDSIIISVEVPLANGVADTVTMGFSAIRSGPPATVLYSGSQDIAVQVGMLSQSDSVRVRYVGPGQNLQSIAISPNAVAVRPGDVVTFSVLSLDSTGATIIGMPVLLQSRSATIATVTAAGAARGVAEGRTYVIATAGARSSVRDSALVVVSTSPAAIIALVPTTASFSAAQGNDPAAQTVAVTNTGVGPLTGLNVSGVAYAAGEQTSWLAATLNQATAPATLTLQPSTGTLALGTYHATVTLAALASNSPQTVAVTFTVIARPAIGLSATAVTFTDTITTADNAAQTVAVTNTANGTLSGLAVGTIGYGTGPTGWLTAALNQATAPATLTLSAAKGSLAAGTYTATVPITSGVASNTPQTVTVTFVVVGGPAIGLSATTVTFTDTITTADNAAQTVAVTNSGLAVLSGLLVGTIDYGTGPTGWLTASLNQATAPATLTLSAAKGSLAAGTYTATVPITAGFAGNAPQNVTVTFTVAPVPLVRMVLLPGFGVLQSAGTLPLAVQGFNAAGAPAPTFGLRFTSRSPSVATVDSLTGLVTAGSGGSAVIVVSAPGTTGTVYDSTLIAVATNGVAVALPVSSGHAFGAANVGDTVHVLVAVNISALPGEKLGSYNAQLNWNPAVLQYVSTAPAGFTAPTLNELNTGSGELRFGAANPSGAAGPAVSLVDVKFVAGGSGSSPVTLALTDLSGISPTFTQMLTQALVLSGAVQVK